MKKNKKAVLPLSTTLLVILVVIVLIAVIYYIIIYKVPGNLAIKGIPLIENLIVKESFTNYLILKQTPDAELFKLISGLRLSGDKLELYYETPDLSAIHIFSPVVLQKQENPDSSQD